MKKINNLYSNTYNIKNILFVTDKLCQTTRNKNKVHYFLLHKTEHITNIYNRLYNRENINHKYNVFMVNDPKCRIIMAQNMEEKIINHLIAQNVLVKVFEPKFTDSMCATRIGKGTLYGIKLMKKYLNYYKNKYDNFYVLKIDIKKYFYNIDHDVLKRLITEKIKDKDALNVLYNIIDSTNENYINEKIIWLKENRINELNNKNLIREVESIPLYKHGRGVALGNQTSQVFGLIYLYKINHYIYEELKIPTFINYMDDFIIIHYDKEYLKKCFNILSSILQEEYKLELNMSKTKIDSIRNGIDFLGYRFILKNNKIIIKLRNITKKNLKRKINIFKKYKVDEKYIYNCLTSYNGIMKWGNCSSLFNHTIKRYYMLEKYYKYKSEYKDSIIFIKCGNFYECVDDDALIMNKVFHYKMKRLNNTFKCGFPINSINNIRSQLDLLCINYLIVNNEEDIIYHNNDINNYNNYTFDKNKLNYNYLRIDRIKNYLDNCLLNDSSDNKLLLIENILFNDN